MDKNTAIKRPVGIVIIATVSAIYAIIMSGLPGFALIDLAASGGKGIHPLGMLSIIFVVITTVFVIAVTIGLWKMKVWGCNLALIGNGATILYILYGYYSSEVSGLDSSVLGPVVNILVIAYLVRLKSKGEFH